MSHLKHQLDMASTGWRLTKVKEQNDRQTDQLIDGGKVMPLLDHLTELRQRVVKSIIAVMAFFIIALSFSTPLIDFLKKPLIDALPGVQNVLHFTGPLDVFMVSIKVSFLASVVFACPVWLYQFWRFVEPALYAKERKYVLPFILISVALFFLGISFCFYFILPLTLEFLIKLGQEVGTPIITITDYISMVTLMIFGFGAIFETPLILVLLATLDLVSAHTLASYRRYVIVGTLIVGAILTPPDPLSQIAMAIPLYIMYEISIVIIRIIQRKKVANT